MHDHDQTLALAAAAIDFELDQAERSQLRDGLDRCPLCRRQIAAMRATATILGRPSDIGTPSRVRAVVVGAAMRGGGRRSFIRPLLLAGLSILVVLGGAAVVVGNRGSAILPPVASTAPTPAATAATRQTPPPSATGSPTQTQAPAAAETLRPSASQTADDNGPLRVGDIAAMVTTGRLVIRTQPGKGTDSAVYRTNIYPGQRMLVLEGPVQASGYPWFHVRLGVIEGWVAARSDLGEPWLAPVRNGLIAFVRDSADGSGAAIYTADPGNASSEALLLADPTLGQYRQLTWSPDGRRLAFVATVAAPIQGLSDVFIVNADGSNLVQVTHDGVDHDSPVWSPDSQRIAIRQTDPNPAVPGGSDVVVLMHANGSGAKALGPGANAAWSPDGQQVAMTVTDGGSSRVWVENADGTNRRRVSDVKVANVRPTWSPDGQRLVFSSSGLSIVDVASGSTQPVTADPGSMPTWSPRGSIAFTTSGSTSPRVFVVDSAGSGLTPVMGNPGSGAAPVWSPDGRDLLLANDVHGSFIAIVDPATGDVTSIAHDGTSGSPAWRPRLP